MNGIFNPVEMKMLEELMKQGVLVGKRHQDKKKYLKELVNKLYMSMI